LPLKNFTRSVGESRAVFIGPAASLSAWSHRGCYLPDAVGSHLAQF
jgi:hypothetical protein